MLWCRLSLRGECRWQVWKPGAVLPPVLSCCFFFLFVFLSKASYGICRRIKSVTLIFKKKVKERGIFFSSSQPLLNIYLQKLQTVVWYSEKQVCCVGGRGQGACCLNMIGAGFPGCRVLIKYLKRATLTVAEDKCACHTYLDNNDPPL